MRPNLGHIEDVPLVFLGFFGAHQLDVDVPDGVVSSFNGFKHIADHVVGVFSGNPGGFLAGEVLNPLLRFDVNFGVFKRAILRRVSYISGLVMAVAHRFSKLVCVSAVRVHVADRPGSAAVTEQYKKLVDAFGVADVETIQLDQQFIASWHTYSQNFILLAFSYTSS